MYTVFLEGWMAGFKPQQRAASASASSSAGAAAAAALAAEPGLADVDDALARCVGGGRRQARGGAARWRPTTARDAVFVRRTL